MITANCLLVISGCAAWMAIDSPGFGIAWACTAFGFGLLAWVAEHEFAGAQGAK
jgi:hypothetical protein